MGNSEFLFNGLSGTAMLHIPQAAQPQISISFWPAGKDAINGGFRAVNLIC